MNEQTAVAPKTFELSDFSYMDQLHRKRCEELQTKMIELEATRETWESDDLWLVASAALGNEDERYCRIYVCESCRHLYHGDYSTNQHETRDFCGAECQLEATGEIDED